MELVDYILQTKCEDIPIMMDMILKDSRHFDWDLKFDQIKYLVENGVDLTIRLSEYTPSITDYYFEHGHQEILEYLLEHGGILHVNSNLYWEEGVGKEVLHYLREKKYLSSMLNVVQSFIEEWDWSHEPLMKWGVEVQKTLTFLADLDDMKENRAQMQLILSKLAKIYEFELDDESTKMVL
jgi:hypothetical protein